MQSEAPWLEAIDGGEWKVESSLYSTTILSHPKGRGTGGTVTLPLFGATKLDRLIALATARFGIKQLGRLKSMPRALVEATERNRLKNILTAATKRDGEPGIFPVAGWSRAEWMETLASLDALELESMTLVGQHPEHPLLRLLPLVIETTHSMSWMAARAQPRNEAWGPWDDETMEKLYAEKPELKTLWTQWDERLLRHQVVLRRKLRDAWPMALHLMQQGIEDNRAVATTILYATAQEQLAHNNVMQQSPHLGMKHLINRLVGYAEILDKVLDLKKDPEKSPGDGEGAAGGAPQSLSDLLREDEPTQLPPWARSSGSTPRKPSISKAESDLLKQFQHGLDEMPDREKGGYGRGAYANSEWMTMLMSTLLDFPEIHSPEIPGLRPRPTDRGVAPRYMERWMSDQRIFGANRQGLGGSVLFDLSGSMSLTSDDIDMLLELLPASVMAVYSGSASISYDRPGTRAAWPIPTETGHFFQEQSQVLLVNEASSPSGSIPEVPIQDVGILRLIANRGARISSEEVKKRGSRLARTQVRDKTGTECFFNAGGCNGIDGPALRWLGEQRPFRIWVSDGVVTGKGDEFAWNLVNEARDLVSRYRILRVRDVDEAIEVAKLIAILGAGAWL